MRATEHRALAILWISVAIIVVVILFPQATAGVVANLVPAR